MKLPAAAQSPWLAGLQALAAGAGLALAFAPFGLYPLALLAPAWLFLLWSQAGPGRAFWLGWCFGFGLFLAGVYWVYVSMYEYGGVAKPVAVLLTAGMAALLALFYGLAGYLQARWFADAAPARRWLWYTPALWVSLEWVRGWFLTGFPWLNLGYSQTDSLLRAYAPVLGVYGVSWAVLLTAAAITWVMLRPAVWPRALVLAGSLWGTAALLDGVEWTEPYRAPLKVTLVQGNIPLKVKWQDPAFSIQHYADLTEPYWQSDLIVWPETAVPDFYLKVKEAFLDDLSRRARREGTALLVGLVVWQEATGEYFNAMLDLAGAPQFYYKRHLVPFGEYIPLQSLLNNLLGFLDIPLTGFSAGAPDQTGLDLNGLRVGISICYEIAFGAEVADGLPAAHVLVNVSNNSWFGDSSAPHQVLQMGRMRTLETQRPLLSATNDGLTAAVDARARVLARAPQFEPAVIQAQIQARQGATPYVRWQDYPVVGLALLSLLAAALLRRRRSSRH